MAEITGTKDLSPSSLNVTEKTSSEDFNLVFNKIAAGAAMGEREPPLSVLVTEDMKKEGGVQLIPEPENNKPGLILSQSEAAILLGWRAACYASGSSAVNRVGDPSSMSEDMTVELSDHSEWELEHRLLEFEGGQFVKMGRHYWPGSLKGPDTLGSQDR